MLSLTSPNMAYIPIVSLYTILVVLSLFAAVGVGVWLWGNFLDRNEHDPARIRAVMFLMLSVTTVWELGIHAAGLTRGYTAWVSLFVAFWGGLDALLRFPAAHDLESLFCVKHFALLMLKTLAYAVGMAGFRAHLAAFLTVFVYTWAMPVLYAMALPMDPCEQVLRNDANDVDITVRVWRLMVNRHERRNCYVKCRGWWYRSLADASEQSILIRYVLCVTSPEHRRFYTKKVRSV